MADHPGNVEELPHFGGSWRRLYGLVLANLVFWIGVMALLTWAFA